MEETKLVVKYCSEFGLISRCGGEAPTPLYKMQSARGARSSSRVDSEFKLGGGEGKC